MFKIKIDYPSQEEELEIIKTTTTAFEADLRKALDGNDILNLQSIVRRTPVPDHVYKYALSLARSTRPRRQGTPEYINDWVSWGAGPRASQYMILAAKARSILKGRYAASIEDVQVAAPAVMRHRIVTNFNAESEGIDQDHIIDKLLKSIPRTEEDYKVKI